MAVARQQHRRDRRRAGVPARAAVAEQERPIAGFRDVHPIDPDGSEGLQLAPTPATNTMSGLAVLDDNTFTIGLALGWRPQISLAEGLQRTLASFTGNNRK